MRIFKKSLSYWLVPLLFFSCQAPQIAVSKVTGKQININPDIPADDSIQAFIAPYKEHIAQEMDSVLAFAPKNLDKANGELNSALGNMMADAVMELANPVFENRTGNSIDVVLLNYGGIRSSLSQGPVTTRTAYELMPFENEVVVATLSGESMKELISYLAEAG
ncbi:MAG TPA: 5'-nucleotidase C-terminal domain-containing protein, partial [Salinimicrobium sp.]|nr:5'-nucleotidase C-terminal domain-containing protein [Salinimicrobium sp.]